MVHEHSANHRKDIHFFRICNFQLMVMKDFTKITSTYIFFISFPLWFFFFFFGLLAHFKLLSWLPKSIHLFNTFKKIAKEAYRLSSFCLPRSISLITHGFQYQLDARHAPYTDNAQTLATYLKPWFFPFSSKWIYE